MSAVESAALAFIRAARADDGLQARIAALGADATLDALAQLAREAGFATDGEALRTAYRRDWGLRWAATAAGRG